MQPQSVEKQSTHLSSVKELSNFDNLIFRKAPSSSVLAKEFLEFIGINTVLWTKGGTQGV